MTCNYDFMRKLIFSTNEFIVLVNESVTLQKTSFVVETTHQDSITIVPTKICRFPQYLVSEY